MCRNTRSPFLPERLIDCHAMGIASTYIYKLSC